MRAKSMATLPSGASRKRISGLLNRFMWQPKEVKFLREKIVLDKKYPKMYRIRWKDGSFSDMMNHSRAGDVLYELNQQKKAKANSTVKNEMVGGLA